MTQFNEIPFYLDRTAALTPSGSGKERFKKVNLLRSCCVRDVGVAGSNPVAPTIDFRSVPDTWVTNVSVSS